MLIETLTNFVNVFHSMYLFYDGLIINYLTAPILSKCNFKVEVDTIKYKQFCKTSL